ncbi:PTS glucose transporter subunit IIA [Niallia sp. 03133]|uniref:PTS glucose transporter subunit IIA n=1 Tax=Niallia sp. 03133 TaxID=3458060 RepID=UPI00404507C8
MGVYIAITGSKAYALDSIIFKTVNLNGKHFTSFVQEGQRVHAGERLIDFDLESIK